jgi:hypothetical protein
MLGILVLTIYLFAFEVVEVDEAAITIMAPLLAPLKYEPKVKSSALK